MKKMIIMLAVTGLLLCACNKPSQPATPSATPSQSPASPSESPANSEGPNQEESNAEQSGNDSSAQPTAVATPVGTEKNTENITKTEDGSMQGEGSYMGLNTEGDVVIMEKDGGSIIPMKYAVSSDIDMEEIELSSAVSFTFKVIDGKNTITQIEKK